MTRLLTSIVRSLMIVVFAGATASAGSETVQCGDARSVTFGDWREWTQVTTKPVRSVGHNNNWVGIYVDKLARDTYLSAGMPYPECAKIVKPIFSDAKGKHVRKLTIMVKMPAGYDPQNGDWWYATYDASGMRARKQGRLNDCIACHKQAADTDYLFSKDVLNTVLN